jgi:Fe2+ or Zn2+ uptake regulation protein
MINSHYNLIFKETSGNVSLHLCNSNTVIREWFGGFAKLIWNQVSLKKKYLMSSLKLNKNQVYCFFRDVTCLYQSLNIKYNIDKDLSKYDFDKECYNMAESILLHIRLSSCHLSYDEVLGHLFSEFKTANFQNADKAFDLLIGNKLILLVITPDGYKYFDKNTNPHNHIYFIKHKKLVDSTQELTELMENVNCKKIINSNQSSLYIF